MDFGGPLNRDSGKQIITEWIRAVVPKARQTLDGEGIRFRARMVELHIGDDAIEIRLPTVEWEHGAYGPIATTRLWGEVKIADLLLFGENQAKMELDRLVREGRRERIAEYRKCRYCHLSYPEEHRFSEDVCHGCASEHLGVVY
jgi:hypothetical protein